MGILIRLVVVAGLAVDAYVHFHLAPVFRYNNDGLISGDWLFRLEALAAAVSAVLLLIWVNRLTYGLAFLVAAGGVAAVLLFSYVNVGQFGPLPTIYEPVWYTEKTISLVAEAIAALAALVGLLSLVRTRKAIPVE